MMNSEEFVGLMSQLNTTEKSFTLGTIDPAYSSGSPKVIFDGESTASSKQFTRLSSYTPTANDRVLIANVAGSNVILGKLV